MSAAFASSAALAAAAFLSLGSAAQAAVKVQSISHGDTINNIAYYQTGLPTGILMDSTQEVVGGKGYFYSVADVTRGRDTDVAGRPNMLRFTFQSATQSATTDGSIYAIEVKATQLNGNGGTRRIPLAGINGVVCNDGNPCLARNTTVDRYYAANYNPGDLVEVDLYPLDICVDYTAQTGGAAATGCVGASPGTVDSASSTNPMGLEFHLVKLASNSVSATDTTVESLGFSLHFKNSSTTIQCNDISNPSVIYFPGDQEILLQTDKFGLTSTVSTPQTRLVVVGQKNATADLNNFNSADVVDRIGFGGEQSATGFENSTATANNLYEVRFLVRDAAGALMRYKDAGTTPASECVLPNVRTAAIRGFLEKGQCFIATAAFQGYNNPAVRLLQRFRDQVLRQSAPGRAFVATYYRLSPPAAEWLIEHEQLRYPVLIALLPLEALAWLALHPFAALALVLVAVFGSLACGFWARRSVA